MYCLAAVWGVLLVWLTLDRVEGFGGGERIDGDRESTVGGRVSIGRGRERDNRAGLLGWLAWIAVALAALYTQYFVGGSVVAMANAIVLLAVLRAWRADRRFPRSFVIRWIGAQVVLLLLFIPWLALAWPALRDWPALGPPVGAGFVAREGLGTFALGTRLPPWLVPWPPLLIALAAVGLVVRGRDGSRWASLVALVLAAVPLLLMGLMSLVRPAWNPKFLIAGASGFELLAGAGLVGIALGAAGLVPATPETADVPLARSRSRVAEIVGLAVACILLPLALWPRAQTLSAMYFDPAYQRDDYRGIAAQIAAEAGTEDAVILDAPTQIEVFDYYNQGRLRSYPLPLGRPADLEKTLARLEEIGRTHRDVYAVLWATGESDPDGIVEGWLNANRYKVYDAWHGNVRLALWAAERERPRQGDVSATFGASGQEAELELFGPRIEGWTARPGEVLTLDLAWRAVSPPRADYVVFAQLLDSQGRLAAQRDMPPSGGTGRMSRWEPGSIIDDPIGLRVPANLAPGDYRWIIGLYDPATGRRLPAWWSDHATDDALPLGVVAVVAP